jgi:hypothetical protein
MAIGSASVSNYANTTAGTASGVVADGGVAGAGVATYEGSVGPVAGAHAHWKYDTGITESGGTVSAWADQSGNGYHETQSSGADQPALNADGSIGFTPGKWTRANGLSGLAQPMTLCVRMRSTVALTQPFIGSLGGSGVSLYGAGGDAIALYAGGGGIVAHRSYAEDEWFSIIAVFNGASSSNTVTAGTATGNPGSGGIDSSFVFNIVYFSGTDTWDCAEAILYNTALSAPDIATNLDYLDSINPV